MIDFDKLAELNIVEPVSIEKVMMYKKEMKDISDDWSLPDENPDNWKGLKDDDYKPDRRAFVLKEFKKDFPKIPISDFEELTQVISRSKIIREWYATVDSKYVVSVNVPTYFSDYVDPVAYGASMSKMEKLNNFLKEDAEERNKLAEEYKRKLDLLDNNAVIERNKILNQDKILFIALLSSDLLPINIVRAITSYTPKTKAAPTQKKYAREALISYKIHLLKLIKNKPDLDIEKYVLSRLF